MSTWIAGEPRESIGDADPCPTCGRGSGDGRMFGMVTMLGGTGLVFFVLGLMLG